MSKILVGVPYLEAEDVNPDGSLPSSLCGGKPVLLMVQGNFCPHCTVAKPALQQLAQSIPSVLVATVQIDGEEGDRSAAKRLSSVNKSPGVPAYLGYDRNGKFVSMHSGGRDKDSLAKFAQSLQ